MKNYLKSIFIEIKAPIPDKSQIETNRINKIVEVAKCKGTFFSDNKITKTPSIAPIPAGKNVIEPNNIEV